MTRTSVARVIAVLSLSTLGLGIAQAAAPTGKYTKKEAEIQATQTTLTKPAERKKDTKSAPSISANDVFQGTGDQRKSITDAQIKTLQRLIDVTNDDDPEKPDLLFRMAELDAEQQQYYNFRARELDQQVFTAQNAGKNDEANRLKANQADYEKKEKLWLTAAVKEYLLVANGPKYASYKRMDYVLFYLAYLLTQQKREDLARPLFKRLIKDFPKSPFIPNAYLSFGEYYFQQKDLENALKFYDKVLTFTDSTVWGYAKYMEGWCYFNLSDFKQALATFVAVIDYSHNATGPKSSRIQLEREAKKDSVRSYARIGTPEKAWPFFQKIGGSYAMTMLEQLGDLYNEQGQFADSIKIFRQLMSIAPNDPKLCFWQSEVMKNTLSMTGARATPEAVKELQRMAAVYDKVRDSKALKPEQMEECRDNTANTLRELATVWHREAQKTNDNATFSLAQYLYKEYLQKFPKQPDAYQMTYYYGELLWTLGKNGDNQKYCEAAPVYQKVVELKPDPNAKYLKDAALAAVLGWRNCLAIDDSAESMKEEQQAKRAEGKAAKDQENRFAPKTIPDKQQKMLNAFDVYIKYVPDSKDLANIKYQRARVYYEYNHIDEAIPLFKDLAENNQQSDLAVYAANLLLDCLTIKKRYRDIETELDKFMNSPQLLEKDPSFKANMVVIRAGLLRKHIEELEKSKSYREAADLYMELATDYPNDPKIDEIYFNAGIDYERAKLIGQAIVARGQLIKIKPDSPLAKKAIFLIGRNYQAIAAFEAAADNYEQFTNKYPGETDASSALLKAAFFRRGLGENEKSIADTQQFTKLYGGRKEFIDRAAEVNFGEGQIFTQQKDWDRLQKHLSGYLKQWGAKGGVDRELMAHVELGMIAWRASCPVAGVNNACIEVSRVRAGGAARVAQKTKKGKKTKKGADLPPTCGPATKSKITVIDRKPQLVKEAQAQFAEALKLYKGGAALKSVPSTDEAQRTERANNMAYYAAEARMMQSDQQYEKFLSITIPEKMDFNPPTPEMSASRQAAQKKKNEEAGKLFLGYLTNKQKTLDATRAMYQSVIQIKQAHWAIAAAARIGQLYQDSSGQLYTAQVPKAGAVPQGIGMDQAEWETNFHDSYCDHLVDVADKFESRAIEGLTACLDTSTRLSWFNEWSSLCENELNQLKPAEYPLAAELRAQPGFVNVTPDRATVQALESK